MARGVLADRVSREGTSAERVDRRRERWPARHRDPSRIRGAVIRGAARANPPDRGEMILSVDGRHVHLTDLHALLFPRRGLTKGDLLRYYAELAPVLLPHLHDRPMVARMPASRPPWLVLCSIEHAAGNVVDFPVVQDLLSLLWIVNLGCIGLYQWYAPCDDVDRPDAVHLDLEPGPGASFAQVRAAALAVHRALDEIGLASYAKTSGASGIQVSAPIERGPLGREVRDFARAIARGLASERPELLTAECRPAHRPADRVLVDYNQNAWGRTLASVYSVRPGAEATVSAPVGWDEIETEIEVTDFRLDNVPGRVRRRGDLWQPLLAACGRARLPASP